MRSRLRSSSEFYRFGSFLRALSDLWVSIRIGNGLRMVLAGGICKGGGYLVFFPSDSQVLELLTLLGIGILNFNPIISIIHSFYSSESHLT
ncbi:hypothetical protein EV426DRAFT_170581 [Tirmania nivea]|nr:hypothetical protein EV426DRAFT_170581 [Tirmania nivea]